MPIILAAFPPEVPNRERILARAEELDLRALVGKRPPVHLIQRTRKSTL